MKHTRTNHTIGKATATRFLWALLVGAASSWPAGVQADDQSGPKQYKVTITNITRGQSFTPILVASHRVGVRLFTLGESATVELSALAEGGDVTPLKTALDADPLVKGTGASERLLEPGQSTSVLVPATGGANRISLAAMMLPTNDGFIGLNGAIAPHGRRSITYFVRAYDAGSEPNDEHCASIPGPLCGGQGGSPNADGEGFVHVHAGIHGISSLDPAADYDWRNPVARVVIERVE